MRGLGESGYPASLLGEERVKVSRNSWDCVFHEESATFAFKNGTDA
jgi:hypothetical protein